MYCCYTYIQEIEAFARFREQISCANPSYVETEAKDINVVNYLLVGPDLFDRTIDANGMKIKDSKETARALLSITTKKNRPTKIWVGKGTEFAREFK